jgi:hypothetical protein
MALAYATISLCTKQNALELFDGITNEWWLVLDWYRVCASTGTTNFWNEQWTTVDRMYSRRLDPEDSA